MRIHGFPRIYNVCGVVAHADKEPIVAIVARAQRDFCKPDEHVFVNALGCLFHDTFTTIVLEDVLVCSVRVLYHCCFHVFGFVGRPGSRPCYYLTVLKFEVHFAKFHEVVADNAVIDDSQKGVAHFIGKMLHFVLGVFDAFLFGDECREQGFELFIVVVHSHHRTFKVGLCAGNGYNL